MIINVLSKVFEVGILLNSKKLIVVERMSLVYLNGASAFAFIMLKDFSR